MLGTKTAYITSPEDNIRTKLGPIFQNRLITKNTKSQQNIIKGKTMLEQNGHSHFQFHWGVAISTKLTLIGRTGPVLLVGFYDTQ